LAGGHRLIGSVTRRELDLVRAALEERFESEARAILTLDRAVHRGREGINDAEKLTAMEAEVSGPRSLLGETAAWIQKAERDIYQVRAAEAQQRLSHGRNICALEKEMRKVMVRAILA
jgi:hypothetical protein